MVLTTCRKSCCWTPFGTCAKKRECRCHPKADRPRSTPPEQQAPTGPQWSLTALGVVLTEGTRSDAEHQR